MPSQSKSSNDNLDYCHDIDHLSGHLSDPAHVFAPGDELDARLRDVPIPSGYHQRLHSWAANSTLDETPASIERSTGYLDNLRHGPPDSPLGDTWDPVPLPS